MIPLYDRADWAKGYDLVIHNECFADTKDPEYIRRITAAHYKGVNAVVIHCAIGPPLNFIGVSHPLKQCGRGVSWN
jgi:hypothetical protein